MIKFDVANCKLCFMGSSSGVVLWGDRENVLCLYTSSSRLLEGVFLNYRKLQISLFENFVFKSIPAINMKNKSVNLNDIFLPFAIEFLRTEYQDSNVMKQQLIFLFIILYFQFGVSNGRGRRRIHGANGGSCLLFLTTIQNGRFKQETALLTWRCELDFSQQWDCVVSSPDFSQRAHLQNGKLAYSCSGLVDILFLMSTLNNTMNVIYQILNKYNQNCLHKMIIQQS